MPKLKWYQWIAAFFTAVYLYVRYGYDEAKRMTDQETAKLRAERNRLIRECAKLLELQEEIHNQPLVCERQGGADPGELE